MIGAIGAAAQLLQTLRDTGQSSSPAPSAFPPPDGTTSSTFGSTGSAKTGTAGVGNAAQKLITDLNALLLNLQSGGGTSTGTGSTGTGAAASATTGATQASSSSDLAKTLEADLSSLGGALSKTGKHGHHHHGAPPTATDGTSPLATLADGTAQPGATTPGAASRPPQGLRDAIAKAISAYSATSTTATASGLSA